MTHKEGGKVQGEGTRRGRNERGGTRGGEERERGGVQ